MVDISVGGLSPTINWGDLKHQEFLLPPKEEQTKLAELLWAMDNVIEREKAIFHMCNISFKAEMNLVFVHSEEPYIRLKKHIDLSTGKRMKGGGQKEGEVLSIGGENIDDNGNLILDKVVYISEEFFQSMKSGVIQKEDILMMKDGAKTGKVAYVNEKIKAATNEHLFIVRSTNNYFLQEFIFFFLLSDFGQMQIQNFFHGIIGGVTREDVQDLKIPNYSIERQKVFINLFKSYRDSIKICSLKIDSSHTLLKSLINQVF
jgi:type I restriction enzyme S subunit